MYKFFGTLGILTGAFIGIPTSFILEAMGTAGAFWGVSEAIGLRNNDNKDIFKIISLTLGIAGFIKHVAGHLEKINKYPKSQGFFQNLCYSINNPYGATYSQIKQCCCQRKNDNEIYP
jgi:hypothetical protein